MSVDHSLVPSLTRADLLLIAQWNAAQERCRVAYRKRRDALDHAGPTCTDCLAGWHSHYTRRVGRGRMSRCICLINDHERNTR